MGLENIFVGQGTTGTISFKLTSASSSSTSKPLAPEKIIYNDRTTIVYWNDGTKTVGTADIDDVFDEKIGFLVCLGKKMFGERSEPKKVIENGKRVTAKIYDEKKDKMVKVRGKTQLERYVAHAIRQSPPAELSKKKTKK